MENSEVETGIISFPCASCKRGKLKIAQTSYRDNSEIGQYEGKSYEIVTSRKVVSGVVLIFNQKRFAVCDICMKKNPLKKISEEIQTATSSHKKLKKETKKLEQQIKNMQQREDELYQKMSAASKIINGTYFPWEQIEFDAQAA